MRAQVSRLPGGRLHLNDGPIDLIVSCDGQQWEVARAEQAAIARFASILDELCAELVLLRQPPCDQQPIGRVARRMWSATRGYGGSVFITPMAAVAGAVAEEVLEVMLGSAALLRASVNNGGDIALHLAPQQNYRIGIIGRPDRPSLFATADITHGDNVRGIATSGWRGRSFSLGIADAVTVLAANASAADAAATMIANAVSIADHPEILRIPASELQPNSDLGEIPVTRSVGHLTEDEIKFALDAGQCLAGDLVRHAVIEGCCIRLATQSRLITAPHLAKLESLGHA